MSFEDLCNTGLTLGRVPDQYFPLDHQQKKKPPSKSSHFSPSDLTLALSSDQVTLDARNKMHSEYSKSAMLHRQASSISGMSSFSNSSVKRERDASSEEVEVERTLPPKVACDDHDEEEGGTRKKLRLTKEQALVLEDSFKEHSTLNPNQKQALAKRLNLRPRQVEVWFQNRRARTKLKQTEVDCELLKKCYDNLTDENRRLHKELKELKASKPTAPPPFYMQFPAATLAVCPSCERIGASVSHDNSSKPQFYGPFNSHPSAAC